ncbi:MAG: type III-A CRISPR-associated protein Csm2 [Candidatus Methanospirare jalkutatii]|nr:type III-A CRISPR-associated protein Csm2 [Candidatus Methanospirare jalkutatii]
MGLIEEIKRDIPSILGGDTKKLVEDAEKLGKHLGRRLSTSQIRIIFSEVKQMQEYDRDKLNLLRPKMAYIAGRHGQRKGGRLVGPIVDLQEVLDECIRKISSEEDFKNFKNFFEAILAYHRYYGGGE